MRNAPGPATRPAPNPGMLLEDIRELRYREGIEDIELRLAIQRLRAGDLVKLTLLTDPEPSAGEAHAGETVLVRITRVRGHTFRGELAADPVSARLAALRAGAVVRFTAAHIHSIPRGRPSRGPFKPTPKRRASRFG